MEISNKYKDFYPIYTRKSTDDSQNQKNSLESQRQRNLAFAKQQGLFVPPLTIAGFCTDGVISESHSAYKQEDEFIITPNGSMQYRILRPKFRALIEALNAKKFKGAIFMCWDRASRNGQDNLILNKLIEQGCDIRFVDAAYERNSSGKLYRGIDAVFSGHFSDVISEKVHNAYDKLHAEGRCTYAAPIGYLDAGSDSKPFDPERAPIVKRIFELYATGEWSFI